MKRAFGHTDLESSPRPTSRGCRSELEDSDCRRDSTSSIESGATQQRNAAPTVVIYLGNTRKEIREATFLRDVWTSGLDSACMVCHRPFNDGVAPPIRTLSFHRREELKPDRISITLAPVAPQPLQVMNRHFDCIKAKKLKYIPISHPWHPLVSSSQQSRTESLEAARLVYQTPVRTLDVLGRKLGPVEIWHDYLSVPQ